MRGFTIRVTVVTGVATLVFSAGASAATLKVTRTDDPVPAACTPSDCSLREAVRRANATAADDRIELRKKTYELTQPAGDEEALTGDLDVVAGFGKLTIAGKGPGKTTIDGNDVDRIFEIFPGGRLSLRGLSLTDGASSTGAGIQNQGSLEIRGAAVRSGNALIGGGIYNYDAARLTVAQTVLSGNEASSGAGIYNEDQATAVIARTAFRGNEAAYGGGIYNQNEATLVVKRSTIHGNEALEDGGGLYNQNDARATIKGSTISGNTATDEGGGIYTQNDSTLGLVNSTLSGNQADVGGGIYANSYVYIRINFSTIAKNTAATTGGAIYTNTAGNNINRPPPFWLLRGTVVAGNSSPGADNCALNAVSEPSHFDSQGSNLEDEDTCFFDRGSDQRNAKAGLRKLAGNGGATKSHALKPSSDAVNAAAKQGCPGKDQRGVKRPQGQRCDAGSYELKQR